MIKVLLIPDAYLGCQSGAVVAQVAKRLLQEIGCELSVFSPDIIVDCIELDGTKLFSRMPYNGFSNWNSINYEKEFELILFKSQATVVFTVGSISNKNLCYYILAKQKGLKVVSKIFMQDFFCINYYANSIVGPCTKCLDNNYFESLKNKCIIAKPIDYLRTLNGILIRKRLEKIMPSLDLIIASSDEQLRFLQKFGVPKDNCVKIPLFFDNDRLKNINSVIGDYYIGIAQNRVEKGFQYMTQILASCSLSIKVILAYQHEEDAVIAIHNNGFQEFIDKGILEIKYGLIWENGLAELVANSRGVIIPSIWPTTTEFSLLEALGYRKPVFCFDVGVHHEIIENGINGFVFPLGDFKSIASQLVSLRFDDEEYYRISAGAGFLYNKLTDWAAWKHALETIIID